MQEASAVEKRAAKSALERVVPTIFSVRFAASKKAGVIAVSENSEHVGQGYRYGPSACDDTIETRDGAEQQVVANRKCFTDLGVRFDEFRHAIIFKMQDGICEAGDIAKGCRSLLRAAATLKRKGRRDHRYDEGAVLFGHLCQEWRCA